MKYYKSGNLKQYLKNHGKLPEEKAIDLLKHIRDAFRFLYSNRIEHRDLKPENIFLDDDRKLIIGDFSNSLDLGSLAASLNGPKHSSRTDHIFNIKYSAPELYMNIRSNNQTTENSDKHEVISKANLWSIGLILYEMLYDQYPPGLSYAYCSNCRRLMQRRKQLQLLSQHLLL